jgi:MerR family transcriptional regulator, light-induced transcriptional regulator
MTSIAEISDEPKYTIKTVCTQTGIRPVTLRAWERRHEILTPHRSENSYRLYSDRDVAVLRWIKNRIDEGMAISRAADELHNMLRSGIWPDALLSLTKTQQSRPSLTLSQYTHQLYQALIKHDELTSANLLRDAHAAFDLQTFLLEIVLPCLREIGDAWYRGEIQVVTEHFASTYLRGRLMSLLQAQPCAHSTPRIMLGCAPTESHEIGTLCLSILLRHIGYRVEFLGPDVPIDDLVDYADFVHANMIILSATLPESAAELRHLQEKLAKLKHPPIFGYGGMAFDLNSKLQDTVPGIYLGTSIHDAIASVNRLLGGAISKHSRER